ncbi:CBS domain-containing protein [Maribacter polysaccharolyticus]|uniref:CBS domain-containing protein n=1 Tax=Maribacter polysaccharolyticus TaxID=3020831 RepID=UPI00237F400C|nr:CBS domain-containing protein [Maribacter polysaccharolyticus]MDE3743616.1 CBS domain-containing protein [Maribacter polysaccharolyticus]
MGIKSFQGARKNQNTTTTEIPLKVSDYMTTKLITFRPEQSVEEVIDALLGNKISGGPVVNDKNELVGMISEGDCIKHISDSRYYNLPMAQATIEQRMIRNVETIDGDMNIFDAANKFLNERRRRFPIVKDGKLVGQISQKDILKATVMLKSQNWKK